VTREGEGTRDQGVGTSQKCLSDGEGRFRGSRFRKESPEPQGRGKKKRQWEKERAVLIERAALCCLLPAGKAWGRGAEEPYPHRGKAGAN